MLSRFTKGQNIKIKQNLKRNKYMKRKIISGILTAVLLFSLSVVALAAQHTENPYGGTWNWGENSSSGTKMAYSNYLLTKNSTYSTNGIHKTTVVGKTTDTSDWVASGVWANSSVPCKWNYTERCYYNLQDTNGHPVG